MVLSADVWSSRRRQEPFAVTFLLLALGVLSACSVKRPKAKII